MGRDRYDRWKEYGVAPEKESNELLRDRLRRHAANHPNCKQSQARLAYMDEIRDKVRRLVE
jgi:hypothetical protein